jgi:hypothetical protein
MLFCPYSIDSLVNFISPIFLYPRFVEWNAKIENEWYENDGKIINVVAKLAFEKNGGECDM